MSRYAKNMDINFGIRKKKRAGCVERNLPAACFLDQAVFRNGC